MKRGRNFMDNHAVQQESKPEPIAAGESYIGSSAEVVASSGRSPI